MFLTNEQSTGSLRAGHTQGHVCMEAAAKSQSDESLAVFYFLEVIVTFACLHLQVFVFHIPKTREEVQQTELQMRGFQKHKNIKYLTNA